MPPPEIGPPRRRQPTCLDAVTKVERNERLIHDDEDRSTGKAGAVHDPFAALQSASARDRRLLRGGVLSRAVDQSSRRNKRDDRP